MGWRWLPIRRRKNRIGEPALEFWIIAELFEQLGVVLHQSDDDAAERLVVLDPRVLFVGILFGILISDIRCDLIRDLGRDELANAVCILPGDIPEEIVETPDNVGKP